MGELICADLENLENRICSEALASDLLRLRRSPVLLVADFVDCRFHLASDLEVIFRYVFVHIDCNVVRAPILENLHLVLIVGGLHHVRAVCHEDDDARLDAIVEELFVQFLVLLRDLIDLATCEVVEHVDGLAEILQIKDRVLEAVLLSLRSLVILLELHQGDGSVPNLLLELHFVLHEIQGLASQILETFFGGFALHSL